ncbi:MAG: DciA family protein [Actinomycetota bacterium]
MSARAGDPQRVSEILDDLIEQSGWQDRLNLGRLKMAWPSIVGQQISSHCTPVRLTNGVLSIKAEAGVWAAELTMLSKRLRALADDWLGGTVVTEVKVWADR